MNEASLTHALRRYYAEQHLSDDVRSRLSDRLRRESRREADGRRVPWLAVGVAAAVLVAIVIGAVIIGARDRVDMPTRVAAEIARNHQKHPEVEIASDAYGPLRSAFEKLDFALVAPRSARLQGLTLVGARYCSVQGHIAVQMRLDDERGQRTTLYQVRDVDTFSAIEDGDTVDVSGLRVELWRENGVLLGLARPVR